MSPSSRGALSTIWYVRNFKAPLRRWVTTTAQTPIHVFEPTLNPQVGIRLRQYQEECIQSVVKYLKDGHKRLGISLATGGGKTVIFTQLIDRIEPLQGGNDQTLILAHRQELVEQAARHCKNAYPSKTVQVEMGSIHANGAADITVASVQSLISGDRISKFDPKRFKLVLVDEAHHIVAPGYRKILGYFGLSELSSHSPVLVGVSATLSRFDGIKLGSAIDHIVYHKDYVDMIGENWLSDVIFTSVKSTADISKVKMGASGDFQPGALSRAVNKDHINEITVRTWSAKASSRKSTLVFCVDIAHVVGLTKSFRAHGLDARFVTGNTSKVQRSATLDSFRTGEFPILLNCGVFTEGTDIPNIDCVLLARPTKSRNLLVQMIGRGMRLHPGKVNCHVIDMVASLTTGIATTPTLFGLDPSELVNNANIEELKSIKNRREVDRHQHQVRTNVHGTSLISSNGLSTNITFTDYDSVFDLMEDTSGERHIRAISPNAWVDVGQSRFVLSVSGSSFLSLERSFHEGEDKGIYIVRETKPLVFPGTRGTFVPYTIPREIARCEMFVHAVHAADTFAKEKFPYRLISRNQKWRNGRATEGQLVFLNKLRPKDDPLTPETITKGRAGDMVTKIKHGARGRFAKVAAEKRKEERAKLKADQQRAASEREEVRVGPLLD